jgi:hypothetical protein
MEAVPSSETLNMYVITRNQISEDDILSLYMFSIVLAINNSEH